MRCPNCELRLLQSQKLDCCPVCGTIIEAKAKKPGFERTWALIQEDQLKKRPERKQFDQTWQWYAKAIQANPAETVFAAQFLKNYPDYQPDLASFKDDTDEIAKIFPDLAIGKETENNRAEDNESSHKKGQTKLNSAVQLILRYGALHNDPASTLQLSLASSQDQAAIKTILEKIRDQDKLNPVLKPLYYSLNNQFEAARTALKALFRMEPAENLILDRPIPRKLLCSIAGNKTARIELMEAAIKNGQMEMVLQTLYRPLDDSSAAFDHLYHLPLQLSDYLQASQEQWFDMTRQMLEQDQCLRGIHISLQTLKQQHPQQSEEIDKLLQLQYEKAYLRPFKEIEQTDFAW